MGLSKGIEIYSLDSVQGGMSQFYTPQTSDETMLVEIPPNSVDDLFVHHFQTDQLLVVRGSFVLVVLHNRKYQYICLRDRCPQVVKIPPGVPHGAINPYPENCVLVNAVIRHGMAHPKDYQPLPPPFPYNLDWVNQQFCNSRMIVS